MRWSGLAIVVVSLLCGGWVFKSLLWKPTLSERIDSGQITIEYPGRNPGEQGLLLVPATGMHFYRFSGSLKIPGGGTATLRHLSGFPLSSTVIADVDVINPGGAPSRKTIIMDRERRFHKEVSSLSSDWPMRSAMVSPDGTAIAYTYMAPPDVLRPILCILDLSTNVSYRVEQPQSDTWMRQPMWSLDSKRLVYEKVKLAGRSAKTSIWEYSLELRTSRMLMAAASNAAAAVFVSNTELVTFCDEGLVKINEQGDVLTTILSHDQIHDLQYLGSGITYLPNFQIIAMAFQDRSGKTSLVRVRSDGTQYTRLPLNVSNVVSIGNI